MAHYYFENTPHGTRKNGTKLNTKTHYDYIFREGEYAHMENREEDLTFTSYGNMPSWADHPGMFWEEAEAHRDKPDGRAYREFRFALQEEFTLAENMELVEQLLKETGIKNHHSYSYAIHDKAATFDKDHRNIHCHLMFNEKIIERDRPLSPDKFFNHYAVNRAGEPTQGYRSSREFITKEMTLQLRKRWAEIVNEKFQEKGLSTCISEKTLNAQREELASSGKNDEAELLNRTPAPHLGSAYRNPVVMQRIMDQIAQTDHESDCPEREETGISSLSSKEQNILVFANDVLLRQVARQIQQERLRLQKEQDAERAKIEAVEIMEEPLTITIGDVYSYLEETASNYRKLANDNLAAYKALKSQLLNDQQLRLATQDKALNHQYDKTRKAYAKTAKELQRTKELATSLYGIPDKTHELAECSKKIKLLTEERNVLGKQLNAYRRAIDGDAKEKINDIFKTLQHENAEKQLQNNRLYAEYLSLKKQTDRYADAAKKLSTENMDMVLFTDRLPATLNRKCKIDGIQPISKLKILVYNGDSYALLAQLRAQENIDKSIDNRCTVTAVKLGDNISRGTVPKYEIQVMTNNNNKWKIHSASIPIKNDATPEIIRLYTLHESRQKNATLQNNLVRHSHPILQAARNDQKQAISSHVSALAEKLISKEKDIHLDAHWNNESDVKDKAKVAEDKMYQGWNL